MLSGDLRKVSGENIEIRTIPVENANIIKKRASTEYTGDSSSSLLSKQVIRVIGEIINDTKRSKGRSNTRS